MRASLLAGLVYAIIVIAITWVVALNLRKDAQLPYKGQHVTLPAPGYRMPNGDFKPE